MMRMKSSCTVPTSLFCLVLIFIGCVLGLPQARADLVTTGDLGNNVISDGGTFTSNLDLLSPDNSLVASLVTTYGLWNSPDVPVDAYFNNNLVGNFVAQSGYISPGPEFITFDITGLLLDGMNEIKYTGSGGGDYVIGQVDINYRSAPVPLPAAVLLLATGLIALPGLGRNLRG